MEQPFILCGLGRVGWRVLEYLRAAGLPVVVVDTQCAPDDPRLEGAPLIQGDCRRQETLEAAGVRRARGVLVLVSDDLVGISTALMVRRLHPHVRVVIRMFNQNLITRLGKAVRNVYALSPASLTGPLLALTALTGQTLGAYRIPGASPGRRQVAELTISPQSPFRGRTVAEVARDYDAVVLAHFPRGGKERFLQDINPHEPLATGDWLVVTGEPQRLLPLLAQVSEAGLPAVRWSGWLRRLGRVAWRTLCEIDLAVKIATSVLITLVLFSTVVIRYSVRDYSFAHAFFRTVSVMATGAPMLPDSEQGKWPEEMEVFAGILRFVGAGLLAVFTALLTQYFLRVRLGGVLEIRRIPDGGHVIVCGLGNVGFRVVEELIQSGERVVVLERAADGRFVTTARRLGAAVIIGDATVKEMLRQAHCTTARAVIAATSDDLVNLEVALLVQELAPSQRVVVRLWDGHLAETLRDSAKVQLALSVPALAAPAFVAALFGDRVQAVFLIGNRMLAAVEIGVTEADTYLRGRSVACLVETYRLVPIALTGSDQQARPPHLEHLLQVGDRLTAIVALPELERLLRCEAQSRDYSAELLVTS